MALRVIHGTPPNLAEIKMNLPLTEDNVFCYGNTLYVPSGRDVPQDILAHEEVHSKRQLLFPSPQQWWTKYCYDSSFRLEEELAAYATQLSFVHKNYNQKAYKAALQEFADNLQKMYNISITFQTAQTLIRNKEKLCH